MDEQHRRLELYSVLALTGSFNNKTNIKIDESKQEEEKEVPAVMTNRAGTEPTCGMNSSVKHERFYITTAINYTNGPPHMGHAYEAVISDAIARYHRIFGRDVFFLTGTDEHGQKVEKSAIAAGKQPIELCDMYVKGFKALDEQLNISYDRFIRTTEPQHEELARKLWLKVRENGDIYLTNYVGWYNIYDEQYVTETEAAATDYKDEHGRPYEKKSEESYFFRMSKYRDALIKLYTENPDACKPEERRTEILSFLKEPLQDLCISRTVCQWGINCPNDPQYKGELNHVMYVWFDALSNYLTGVDYWVPNAPNSRFWPASVHVIGKDIVRFHCIYWPAMLLSAGIPLPNSVCSHGFILDKEGRKMSKSLNNVTDPVELLHRLSIIDSFRFYLCFDTVFGSDLPFSETALIDRHNAHLVKDLGNLLNRVLALLQGSNQGKIPNVPSFKNSNGEYSFDFNKLRTLSEKCMCVAGGLDISALCSETIRCVSSTNKFLADNEPWKLKDPSDLPKKLSIIRSVLESIYYCAHFLAPFIPNGSAEIFAQLGVKQTYISSLSENFDNLPPNAQTYPGKILYPELGQDARPIIASTNNNNNNNRSTALEEGGEKKTRTKHIKGFDKQGERGNSQATLEAAKEEKKRKAEEARLRSIANNQPKQSSAAGEEDGNDLIYGKIDLRVGLIQKVWEHPEAARLYCEEINVGEDKPRNIASGLREVYSLEEMTNRYVIVVCNLKPAKLVGFESNGMVLCAKKDGKVQFLEPPAGSKIGERILLDGFDISNSIPAPPQHVSKKKYWEALAADLKTDSEGNGTWKGYKLISSQGICKCSISDAPIA